MKVCLLSPFFSTVLLCIVSGTNISIIRHCKDPYPPADADKVRIPGFSGETMCYVKNEKPFIGTLWKYTAPEDKDTDPKDIKCVGEFSQDGGEYGMEVRDPLGCTLYESMDEYAAYNREVQSIGKGKSTLLYCSCSSKTDWTVGNVVQYISELLVEGKQWDCIFLNVEFAEMSEMVFGN